MLAFWCFSIFRRAGLSTNYIARLEIGSNTPSLPALISISKALGVQTFELLNVEANYTWLNKGQEIAWLLESLKESDLEYVLDQLQTTIRYIKSQREG